MDCIAKKGDMLFVGEGDDALAVIVFDTIKYNDQNYLKILATPLLVEELIDTTLPESEFAREIASGDNYMLEPVTDKATIDVLNEELKNRKSQTAKEK